MATPLSGFQGNLENALIAFPKGAQVSENKRFSYVSPETVDFSRMSKKEALHQLQLINASLKNHDYQPLNKPEDMERRFEDRGASGMNDRIIERTITMLQNIIEAPNRKGLKGRVTNMLNSKDIQKEYAEIIKSIKTHFHGPNTIDFISDTYRSKQVLAAAAPVSRAAAAAEPNRVVKTSLAHTDALIDLMKDKLQARIRQGEDRRLNLNTVPNESRLNTLPLDVKKEIADRLEGNRHDLRALIANDSQLQRIYGHSLAPDLIKKIKDTSIPGMPESDREKEKFIETLLMGLEVLREKGVRHPKIPEFIISEFDIKHLMVIMSEDSSIKELMQKKGYVDIERTPELYSVKALITLGVNPETETIRSVMLTDHLRMDKMQTLEMMVPACEDLNKKIGEDQMTLLDAVVKLTRNEKIKNSIIDLLIDKGADPEKMVTDKKALA